VMLLRMLCSATSMLCSPTSIGSQSVCPQGVRALVHLRDVLQQLVHC
jgi:hypothetical protein